MATKLKPKRPFAHESEPFVHALLDAQDLDTLATVATSKLLALGLYQIQLIWNQTPGDMGSLKTSTDLPPDAGTLGLLESARRLDGQAQRIDSAAGSVQVVWVVAQNTGLWVALSAHFDPANADPEWRAKVAPLSSRCQSLLYTQRLQVDVERLASAERLQRALFAISDLASSDQSTKAVLHGLHQIVGSLMYAENFYIVRFDPEHQTIRFLYFADTHDPEVPDPDEELSPLEMGNSLTLALLRHGKPMRGPSRTCSRCSMHRTITGLGPDSEDWMGVPDPAGRRRPRRGGRAKLRRFGALQRSRPGAARLCRPAHPQRPVAARGAGGAGTAGRSPHAGIAQRDPRAPAQRATAAGALPDSRIVHGQRQRGSVLRLGPRDRRRVAGRAQFLHRPAHRRRQGAGVSLFHRRARPATSAPRPLPAA